MADIVTAEKRSELMANIKGNNTKPEKFVRTALHKHGFRYRLHDSKLPGKPDLVFRKYKSVIFINGCFWHQHDCHLFKWPRTRAQFWREKLSRNRHRDEENQKKLEMLGWNILIVWECALKGSKRLDREYLLQKIILWLKNPGRYYEITGSE